MLPSLFLLGLTVSLLLVGGCANPINQVTFDRYTEQGHRGFMRGDLASTEEAYRRALINVQVGHLSDDTLAVGLYNFGRVKRFLCKDDEAEQLLRRSIEVGEKAGRPESTVVISGYFELARLYYDQERYNEAVPLMEKGLPIAEKLNVEKTHLAAYVYALDQYADALHKINRKSEAQVIEGKVKALRARADLSREWEKQRYAYERECKGPKR